MQVWRADGAGSSDEPLPARAGLFASLFETRVSKEVTGLFASLGTTRRSVAASLEAAGVRAAPHEPDLSPISLFLSAVVGADPNVKSVVVGGDEVVVELRAWWRSAVAVPVPAVVHDFMAAFDAGCYPALFREEYREHSRGRPE